MFDELWARIQSIPKDYIVPAITGSLSLLGVMLTITYNGYTARKNRRIEEEKQRKTQDLGHSQDFTARFTALMDGYESRIKDLATDHALLKKELGDLRLAHEYHQRICAGCVYFAERSRASGGGSTDY